MSGEIAEIAELRQRVADLEEVCAMLAENLARKFHAKDMRHDDAMDEVIGYDISKAATLLRGERE